MAVHVDSTGSWISTSGVGSTGILAQGAAEDGGISLSLAGSLAGVKTFGDVPIVSGRSGGAGNAGAVLVEDSTNNDRRLLLASLPRASAVVGVQGGPRSPVLLPM